MHAAVWHADIRHSPVATTVFADLWYRSQFHPNGFVCMPSLNQGLKILRNDSAGLVTSYLSQENDPFKMPVRAKLEDTLCMTVIV